ncbi:glycoside hydrolase superfamily [Mycena capillaripes]|nr:glycoside hydrolase superfamily [Mycena capillaripes]
MYVPPPSLATRNAARLRTKGLDAARAGIRVNKRNEVKIDPITVVLLVVSPLLRLLDFSLILFSLLLGGLRRVFLSSRSLSRRLDPPNTVMLPFVLVSFLAPAFAATAEQWRHIPVGAPALISHSLEFLLPQGKIDRFALEPGAIVNECVLADQTCLDQSRSQNYQGPRSAYGDPYHGYWPADISKFNDHFGTADDLKILLAEVYCRNMYLMVDIVVNNVMATSMTPDYSTYMFKDASHYHPCGSIDWTNIISEQQCWLGDTTVPLPDVNMENSDVVAKYSKWISDFVQTYSIDGLRIDAAKHVRKEFWPIFAKSAGVFCMGEVFDPAVANVAEFQGSDALDSVLNYPLYYALVAAFGLPGPQNMSALTTVLDQSKRA